ncbi:MAG TPA: DUF3368 domain-containing protein [Saprospiraceae bacterium]|nr:DUF3368 domain-containing protein [Saprospiraceae bacterium]HMP13637.1 DUF3368 domain-containing protein [Saprospiraceae bacterium]
MIIVSDTTPFSNLLQIDELGLLSTLYQQIIIPTTVFSELKILEKRGFSIQSGINAGWIIIKSPQYYDVVNELLTFIDPGESEAIALAIELQADYLLMDEKEGRQEARARAIPVIGTLGILLEAKKRGLIPNVKTKMDALRNINYWISEELYQQMLVLAGE